MSGDFSIRNLLFALALVAMGVRGLAAPGYMFAPSTSGLTVTLCGGETMHVDFGRRPAPGQSSDHAPCLFAAAAHAAPAPIIAEPAPIFVTAIYAPPSAMAARVGQGLAAPPPPSTGPPLVA
jgi:hypothetical protein